VDMQLETTKMFQLLLQISSSLWRRQIRPYACYPWSLAILLDADVPEDQRVSVADDFKQLSKCCREVGVCEPLHAIATGSVAEVMVRPDSRFFRIILVLFSNKVTNISCEDNFARASTTRQYMHGNFHHISTMTSKHCAAELLYVHNMARLDAERGKRGAAAINLTPGLLKDVAPIAGPSASLCSHAEVQTNAKTNRWILFFKRRMDTRPALAGELPEARRKRIWQVAKDEYHHAAFAQELESLGLLAKRLNKESKFRLAIAVSESSSSGHGLLEAFGGKKDIAGVGPWELADADWPISFNTVDAKNEGRGFVKEHDSNWQRKHSAMIDEKVQPANYEDFEPLCQKLGGCYNKLSGNKQRNLMFLLGEMKNVVRSQSGRREKYAAAMLLVAQKRVASSSRSDSNHGVKVYFIVELNFSPLDLCLWECEVAACGGLREDVWCPTAFTARLGTNVFTTHDGSQSRCCPKMMTMHNFVYAYCGDPVDDFMWSIVETYKVQSLNTVLVDEIEAFSSRVLTKRRTTGDHDDQEDLDEIALMKKSMQQLRTAYAEPCQKRASKRKRTMKTPRIAGAADSDDDGLQALGDAESDVEAFPEIDIDDTGSFPANNKIQNNIK
jgi:hypothetical protein